MPVIPTTNHLRYIDDQSQGNYQYDEIGNLIRDASGGLIRIDWMRNGKISEIPNCRKVYELTNHLGNVMVTIGDQKTGVDADGDLVNDYYMPTVLSYADYYPFGMLMPERNGSSDTYRFGFNGKENDDDVYWTRCIF